jgi:hypothetical protein
MICGLRIAPGNSREVKVPPGHYCSIRWATRHEVHRLVSYPRACGPRFSPRSMRRKSSAPRRGLRPARPACRSARTPPLSSCRCQRLTDCRCTPTRRATSAGCTPWRNSRAPNNRRLFQLLKIPPHSRWVSDDRRVAQDLENVTILFNARWASTVKAITPQ